MTNTAVFMRFVGRLPEHRNFRCRLESVLAYLEKLRFTDSDLAYLRSLKTFSDEFVDSLGGRSASDPATRGRGVAKLPAAVTALAAADPPYPVRLSAALEQYHERVRDTVMAHRR